MENLQLSICPFIFEGLVSNGISPLFPMMQSAIFLNVITGLRACCLYDCLSLHQS